MKNICEIKEQEVLKCAELYVEVFNAEPWNDEWTVEKAELRLKDIFQSPHFTGILYQEERKVLGAIFGTSEQYFNGRHYNLREMFIATNLQRKGIGRRMMEELEIILKRKGVTNTVLFTSKDDQINHFYAKNGFHELNFMCMMFKDL